MTYRESKRAFEREYTENLLAQTDGNVSAAAKIAGVDRTTFYLLMKKSGVQRHAATTTEAELRALVASLTAENAALRAKAGL